MIHAMRARMGKREEGFSLIELMIVVLIIAILIAIAIPTFLGARTKSQERAAQVDLRQGLLTAKSQYTDTESFLDTDQATTEASYEALEPSLDFTTVAGSDVASSPYPVGVLATADTVLLVRESASGDFFCIAEDIDTGTTYGSGAAVTNVDTLGECVATSW